MEEICKNQKLEFDKNSCGCVCGEWTIWDCDKNSCVEWNAYCKKLGKIFDWKWSSVCDKWTEQVPWYSNCVKIKNQDKSVAVEKSLSIAAETPLKITSEVGYVILWDGTQDTTITALEWKYIM